MQISPEQLRHKINVLERRNENVAQGYNVLVSKMLEKLEFPVCSLCENGCGEGFHDLLNSDRLLSQLIFGRTAITVSSRNSPPA